MVNDYGVNYTNLSYNDYCKSRIYSVEDAFERLNPADPSTIFVLYPHKFSGYLNIALKKFHTNTDSPLLPLQQIQAEPFYYYNDIYSSIAQADSGDLVVCWIKNYVY